MGVGMKWVVLCVGCFICGITAAEMRTWTGSGGQTVEAEYVADAGANVTLKMRNGEKKRVPISALSQDDQAYIYNRKPPVLEINFDQGMKRKSVKGDIDNKKEEILCRVEVRKTNSRPYYGKMTIHLFVLGKNLYTEEYELLQIKKETFELTSGNDHTHTLVGSKIKLEHDPYPGSGVKYEGYLVCVKGSDGKILMCKGKKKFEEKLRLLMDAEEGASFDEDMRPVK